MLIPVILAGGLGTRLWPVSRPERPKPLARLTGELSLLQTTALRTAAIPDAGAPLIVCGESHYPLIARQLDDIGLRNYAALLEPMGRSTAPAAAAAALAVDEDDLMLILPADHLIEDTGAFVEAIRSAADAARADWLVTFGVVPDRPETGYGYIERGEPIEGLAGVYRIASFREKPDLAAARRYLNTGRHSWNSGMFLFRAGTYLEELRMLHPEIPARTEAALAAAARPGGALLDRGGILLEPESFSGCPSESIDRAVMERTRRGATAPLAAGWSDVGSWYALWELGPRDEAGNVVSGPAHLRDVTGSYVRARERPVTVIGLEGVIVVDDGNALLVAGMDHAQAVKPPPVQGRALPPDETGSDQRR